jgi:transcriptional regulator with XRE-family HTH domain
LRKQLSQQELAGRLGLRQRQISDLERATTDHRLSTIQNVARALDLELMLIPRHLISAVDALERAGTDGGKRPLYALGDDDTDDISDELPQTEVGETGQRRGPAEHHQSRPRARSTS